MYKQLLILDSSKANIVNNKYEFNLSGQMFRVKKYRIKKYICNGINNMSTNITYLCCPELAEMTINRNSDNGLPTDIVAVITNDNEIDPNHHEMFTNRERWFKKLTIYFKQNNQIIQPSNFVVVLDIEKET